MGVVLIACHPDIVLDKPDVQIGVFEEYIHGEAKKERGRILSEMRRVWMGKKVRRDRGDDSRLN